MAMYDVYAPKPSQVREAFDQAAVNGHRYLLLVTETGNDELQVTDWTHTHAVKTAEEIPAVIAAFAEGKASCFTHRLDAVYDATRPFDAQAGQMTRDFSAVLPRKICQDIDFLERESRYRLARSEWNAQPWLTRFLSTPPLPPKR